MTSAGQIIRQRRSLLHDHAARRQSVRKRLQVGGQGIAGMREQVVGLEGFGLRKPKVRNLRQHLAFARNAVGHDDVESRDSIGGNE